MDHHAGTEDTTSAGSQQVPSRESSWNLEWAVAAGSGKGLGSLSPFSPGG